MSGNLPISLSMFTIDDAAAHLAGEDVELQRWLSGGPGNLQTVTDHLRRCQQQWHAGGPVFAFAIRTETDHQLAGTVEVQFDRLYLQPGQVNISYGVYPAWRKRGVAGNAVELACEFARARGAHQAIIRVEPGNEASVGVARRSGFTFLREVEQDGTTLRWWRRDLAAVDGIPAGLAVQDHLILLVGPPGAGKSHLARRLVAAGHIDGAGIVSADRLTLDMFPGVVDSDTRYPAVFAEVDRLVRQRLEQGLPVIVDATNVRHEARARLIDIAHEIGRPITAVRFATPTPVALVRNLARDDRLPDEMVREYAAVMAAQAGAAQLRSEGIGAIIDVA